MIKAKKSKNLQSWQLYPVFKKVFWKGNFYIRYLQSDIGVIIITLNGDDIY